MTIKELKKEAKRLNLIGYSQLKKEELERLIAVSKQEVIEMSKEEFESSISNTGIKIFEYSDEEDWLSLREKRIGGSDIGAIVGVNPYKSIIDVYIDKVQSSTFKGNEATHWGHMLEGTVMKEFASRHNELVVYEVPYSVVDDFLIANLDGVLKDKETGDYGVLEIKTTSVWNKKEWEEDVIPQSYYAQVQHYLMLTGYKFAYVAVLIGGQQYKEFRVERNEEDIELIKNKATEFYQENILKEVPPMPDGSDAYMEYLKKKSLELENDVIIELEGFEEKAAKLKEISKKKKELEEEETLIKSEIMSEMIKENTLKAVAGKYKFNIQSRNSANKKAMADANPELVEEYDKLAKQYTMLSRFLVVR